ncbi:unnamed protein product, partial [Brassica rapa subsp. narinosa]
RIKNKLRKKQYGRETGSETFGNMVQSGRGKSKDRSSSQISRL